jgi:arginase family enzyme
MFGAPRWSHDERYDVVFVGVPSDAGALGWRSAALGPLLLREQSQNFPITLNAHGECVGWHDYVSGRTLLRSVRIADAGDFVYDRRLGAKQLDSLPAVYATLRDSTRLLCILGGDHSITYQLAQALRDEGLLWIDAHEDATARHGPHPHCGNVVSYIDLVPSVTAVVQFGLRGIVPAVRSTPPPQRRQCRSTEEIVAVFRERNVTSIATTIDVDVFDPTLMPAVAAAMPEGLQPADVLRVLGGVAQAGIRISVLELAEFAPLVEADAVPALALVNFLLRGMAECLIG